MSFIIYNNKRFKHPIRYLLLFILLMISLVILIIMWEKQQQFKDQQQNLTTLQEQLDKLNKQNKELTKNLVSSEHSEIMLMIYKLNQYPRETILLKKMDYNKNLNQFEISGESTSIENIGLFKDSLLEHDLVKDIEIISTSYLTESKVYKVEFSLKGTL